MSVIELNDASFSEVLKSEKAVVEFSAPWCGPCKMFSPIFDKVAEQETGVDFFKVDVDSAREASSKHSIMSVPSVLFLKKGEEVGRSTGLLSEDGLKAEIEEKLGK